MGIAVLLLNLVPGLLKGIPGISAGIQQIIADVTGSASAVLSSGVISGPNVNTVLAAWLGVVNTLKADPNLPTNMLNAVGELEKAISAALMNDVTAQTQVDWNKVVVIQTV